MKVLCLGAVGKISRESAYGLVEFSDFEKVTIADINQEVGMEVVRWLDDPRVGFEKVDVYDRKRTVELIHGYDMVPEPTTMFLFGTGLIGLAGMRKKLKK